ncbi:MAG: PHP domain-containing protein [Candidatus Gracilibacteria bacterium]|nr:PHP domain-containing protein [Candidatus Gracilibacteria bacterium]
MKIDMHFHSKLSDGRKTSAEIIKIAKDKNMDFIACTDHDIINSDFPALAEKEGIRSCEAVEISGFDSRYNQHLHLTCYSRHFSRGAKGIIEGDGNNIYQKLDSSREGRQQKARKQIQLLKSNGFDINEDEFFAFFKKRGINHENVNSSHISNYIFAIPGNISHIKKLTGEDMDRVKFLQECLKDEGRFHQIGAITVPEYEPTLEICGNLAKDNDAILSLAHPNFKITMDTFKQRIGYYLNCGINAVEINAKATKEWVNLILEYQKEYKYLITFGSDSHFRKNDDKEHGEFGIMNPYMDESALDLHIYYVQKKLGLINPISIPKSFGMDLGDDILEYSRMRQDQNDVLQLAGMNNFQQ